MKTSLVASILGMVLAGSAGAEPLQVTVYNKAGLTPQVMRRTAEGLRFILRHSDIQILWIDGDLAADEASLLSYSTVINQEQGRRLACQARRDIAVAILPVSPARVAQTVLGMSLPLASEGINVQVYGNHVAYTAASHSVPEADVLAHAIAHEIGHVLLRSGIHTGNGLMAAAWAAREFSWMKIGSMFFTPDEGRTMRTSISGASCVGPVAAN